MLTEAGVPDEACSLTLPRASCCRGMPDLTLLNALLSLANFTLVGANTTAGGSRTTDFSGTVFLATNAAVQAFLRQQVRIPGCGNALQLMLAACSGACTQCLRFSLSLSLSVLAEARLVFGPRLRVPLLTWPYTKRSFCSSCCAAITDHYSNWHAACLTSHLSSHVLCKQNVTQRELLEGSDKLRSVMAYHVLPRRLAYADLGGFAQCQQSPRLQHLSWVKWGGGWCQHPVQHAELWTL